MIKCLMLDVDGVLIDGRPEAGKHWSHDLKSDLNIDPEQLHSVFFVRHWPSIIIGATPMRPALEKALREMNSDVSAQKLISYWFEKDSLVVAPVLDACRSVRESGIKIFLATNQEHERARYLRDELRLGEETDGILYSAELGARKPDPEFFELAQSACGFRGQEVLLVDDTLENVEAARRMGWQAVHWNKDAPIYERLSGLQSEL